MQHQYQLALKCLYYLSPDLMKPPSFFFGLSATSDAYKRKREDLAVSICVLWGKGTWAGIFSLSVIAWVDLG